jgi:hypothetical protein
VTPARPPRSAAVFVAAWGVGLLVLEALGPVLGERDRVALAALPAAALGAFLLAAWVAWLGRRPPRADAPATSVGAAALGLGLVLAGAGAAVGLWLVYLGAPLIVVGVYALVTEGRR